MPNLVDLIAFLKKVSEDTKALLLLDGEAEITFGVYEFDKLVEVIEYLELTKSEEVQDRASNHKLDRTKLPQGFFDNPLALTSKDLIGLPDDLIEELSDLDETEVELLELFEMAGGTLVLDKIIAGLFHLTGKSYQRQQITAKLYRMTKKGLIRSLPKKKGVYTTTKKEDDLY